MKPQPEARGFIMEWPDAGVKNSHTCICYESETYKIQQELNMSYTEDFEMNMV